MLTSRKAAPSPPVARLKTTSGVCRHCGRYGPRWCWYPVDDAEYHVISFTECCSERCYRCKFELGAQCAFHSKDGD